MSSIEKLELKREVLLKLIKALLEGEELDEIAKIISMDPNLSAKLLKFINSPYFGLKKEIKSIVQAIAYLGYRNLKDYVFLLLTSSMLKNANKDEIKRTLKLAYLMRELAKRLMPEHDDEAYMVGILEQVREEIGEEIREILEKAGVSEYVVNGLLNPESKLGKLKEAAKRLLEECDRLNEGAEVELPPELSLLSREELIESCLVAEDSAQSILATL
ncbi:HDOD domain-containing protein [Thermovibrio ammonificans]|uniref:Signal transduction protein n=1 Tax=Thermovibrio ammonificans (strain DSM 15698 / JCM 12110 / HB-1) TaxID=648996 RepID=E8T4Z7_THEA1|nr:HDOD domain-containing protein [Thermovibrio ammonificans]ADU97529.1 putative signal transduction protein [Thermovibrio ammonificans HB-1]